ncbi:MAG: glycosyl transferase [Phycisphaerae bacterium]|nr:glycosyl transferase [Phycisphaerae bacterium]
MSISPIDVIACLGLVMVLVPSVLAVINMTRLGPAPTIEQSPESDVLVSCCIPARNEQENIRACIESLLDGDHRDVEVLVYDDQSTDETPGIIRTMAEEDSRVRKVETVELPAGYNGKQHACQRMGEQAAGEWILFTDADVRFEKGWLRRTLAFTSDRPGLGLVSAFPNEQTGTVGEALLVPMIHVILLGYLPMGTMRRTTNPSASAGCGQFLLARKQAWIESGGHEAFRDSMHDGIRLPRSIRSRGWGTDLVDGTDLCRCRMYRGFAESFNGFAKNAWEGLGSIWILLLLSVIHLVGHLLPWFILAWCLLTWTWLPIAGTASIAAIVIAYAMRIVLAIHYQQAVIGVVLHPVGVLVTTIVQWWSLALSCSGRRTWKGRVAGSAG